MAFGLAKLQVPPGVSALLVGLVLLAGVNFLPPDTSLRLIRKTVLRVCVRGVPPLVTGDSQKPGYDIELLREIATRMNLRLSLNTVTAMGRDFNPRNWRINRGSCEVVAGGVTTSSLTRSFIETLPTGIENGWVLVSRNGEPLREGMTVGVFPGFSGLDRTRLSTYLRSQGVSIKLARSADELLAGLRSGAFDAAVSGYLDIKGIAAEEESLALSPLPGDLGVFQFGLGLWKGDLTLKRELLAQYEELERSGFVERVQKEYGLAGEDAS